MSTKQTTDTDRISFESAGAVSRRVHERRKREATEAEAAERAKATSPIETK